MKAPSVRFWDRFYSFSTDAGLTWSPNEPLSDAWDWRLGMPQGQYKIGDYYHMVSDNVGAHLAWAATFNGEHDVYYMRIGDYDCNANSIPDSEDIRGGTSPDCNDNGIPDECELAAGTAHDRNHNGILDECECLADLNADGRIDLADLGILLSDFGCAAPAACPGDVDGDGDTDLDDVQLLLNDFGLVCP